MIRSGRASEQGGLGTAGTQRSAAQADSDRKKAPSSFLFSRSRGLALLLFGCFRFGLSSKRTEIRPDANGGRRRPRKEQDDTPLRYAGGETKTSGSMAGSFLLWVRLV